VQGFSKVDRVRKRAEIQKIFARGARFSCKGMRIHVVPNSLAASRAVFVPVHSYPNAVARNRARRVVRECWRLDKARLSAGHDVAVVLYPGFDRYDERKNQLERLLRQAGLIT
jgi:ribonuclease P protein component